MPVPACPGCPGTPSLFAPFDDSAFMARIYCGNWSDWLVTGWVTASVGLLLLYWTIAVMFALLWWWAKGSNFPRGRLLWIAAFFVGCGGSHVMNALAFVWPAYVFFILWDWYTLVVSFVGTWGVYGLLQWVRSRIYNLEEQISQETTHAEEEKNRADQLEKEVEEKNRAQLKTLEDRERILREKETACEEVQTALDRQVRDGLDRSKYEELSRMLRAVRGIK